MFKCAFKEDNFQNQTIVTKLYSIYKQLSLHYVIFNDKIKRSNVPFSFYCKLKFTLR